MIFATTAQIYTTIFWSWIRKPVLLKCFKWIWNKVFFEVIRVWSPHRFFSKIYPDPWSWFIIACKKQKHVTLANRKRFYVVLYLLVMPCNLEVSLDLHRIFKYLLESLDSSDAVCFSLPDKSSLEVWRHCPCCSNSGNVTSEADFLTIVVTFKHHILSCFATHTHSCPHIFSNSTLCI